MFEKDNCAKGEAKFHLTWKYQNLIDIQYAEHAHVQCLEFLYLCGLLRRNSANFIYFWCTNVFENTLKKF